MNRDSEVMTEQKTVEEQYWQDSAKVWEVIHEWEAWEATENIKK